MYYHSAIFVVVYALSAGDGNNISGDKSWEQGAAE